MLLGTGASVAKQLPDLVPTRYQAEEKQRLQTLLKKQQAGDLGLTDEERRLMEGRLTGGITAASEAAANERARFIAGSGTQVGGGQALLQAQLADEQKARAISEANAKIEEANMMKKQQQEEDILALRASIADVRAKRVAALGNVAAGALVAYATNKPLDNMMKQVSQMSPEQLTAFNTGLVQKMSTDLKLPPEKTEQLLQTFSNNPDLASYYLMASRGGK